jgi:hypothetical protein
MSRLEACSFWKRKRKAPVFKTVTNGEAKPKEEEFMSQHCATQAYVGGDG